LHTEMGCPMSFICDSFCQLYFLFQTIFCVIFFYPLIMFYVFSGSGKRSPRLSGIAEVVGGICAPSCGMGHDCARPIGFYCY
jgi:hypothetical protein